VGSKGSVLRYKPPVNPGIDPPPVGMPDAILYQNSPNPAKDETKVVLVIPWNCVVQLEMYDLCGRKVMPVLKEDMKQGRREVMINVRTVSPGIYVYRVSIENTSNKQVRSESRKMVVLR
jgi:hypothetical protein